MASFLRTLARRAGKKDTADSQSSLQVQDDPRSSAGGDGVVAVEHYAVAKDDEKGGQLRSEKDGATPEVIADDAAPTTQNEGDAAPAAQEEDESKYLSGTKLALLTFGLATSTFVVALDNTIIGELIRPILLPTDIELIP